MSKKEFLELLIKTYGLKPNGVRHYRTDGCNGQYETKAGWEGWATDNNGDCVFSFAAPDGYEAAVLCIIRSAIENDLSPQWPDL